MNKKMEEVKEANIRVVSEDFLQDISASTKSLQELLSTHLLSPWGAEVKVEPVEAVAPRGKSGAAPCKKSKGPVKEEGEALGSPALLWPHRVHRCRASPSVRRRSDECCGLMSAAHTSLLSSFSLDPEWQQLWVVGGNAHISC